MKAYVYALLFDDRCVRRAYVRVRIVAAACLRWCRCDPDRAVECAFQKSEIFNPRDPIKDSIIVNAFCNAIDGYGKDLQSMKVYLTPCRSDFDDLTFFRSRLKPLL